MNAQQARNIAQEPGFEIEVAPYYQHVKKMIANAVIRKQFQLQESDVYFGPPQVKAAVIAWLCSEGYRVTEVPIDGKEHVLVEW